MERSETGHIGAPHVGLVPERCGTRGSSCAKLFLGCEMFLIYIDTHSHIFIIYIYIVRNLYANCLGQA